MDYEGIYRKTGGSSQSKAITQLFERGQYESFDLLDTDSFNDISSVTSVLKNYFRALPNPLLTYNLHESFVQATSMSRSLLISLACADVYFAAIKDPRERTAQLAELVRQLPREHYATLAALMLHLNRWAPFIMTYRLVCSLASFFRVRIRSDENLMNARNLGVVFGRKSHSSL